MEINKRVANYILPFHLFESLFKQNNKNTKILFIEKVLSLSCEVHAAS